ncbi:MAG: SDR family oxidoreductase [Gordonia sp. (in: high G+C Gram-positive bacteria)]
MSAGALEGRNAVVTGAAGGIGAAVVEAFRSAGAQVHAWDLHAAPGVRGVDVADRKAVAEAWSDTEHRHGPIDLLVSAAGVMSADWDLCLAVNAGGVRNMLDAATPAMAARGRGSVVVVSSNAAAVPRTGFPAYAASKAAATSYARSVGLSVAGSGVRVNIVSPGSTDSPMTREMWTTQAHRDAVLAGDPEQFRLGIPVGRIATPADVAATVLFLASDAARHVTLHDLRVDGGATLDA